MPPSAVSAVTPNPESVRVICRFRPNRTQLYIPPAAAGLSDKGTPASARKAKSPPAAVAASGQGIKLEYHEDGKSIEVTLGGKSGKPTLFTFDRILPPKTTQADAFEAIAKETVADILKGYNGSIFAYGQTGSGKSHSMFGVKEETGKMRGVIPRAADELFAGIANSDELEEVTIRCSFLEVYREQIRDLLQPKNTGLKVRELPNGDVYVQNLSDEYVASCEEIMQLLAVGEKNRSVAATDMNEVSSRSHSVLIIVVNQKLKDGSVRVGKLNLADLAGSERVERTNASGQTLEEAKKINQSLSALGNCINALTDTSRTHVPFRDSTLTFLLKDSLGGNTKTTLLVCASEEDNDAAETMSTLQFAKRAKSIKNKVSVNIKLGVKELSAMLNEVRKELALAHKTIIALQKVVRTLMAGGTIPKQLLDELLKPPAGSDAAAAGSASLAASSDFAQVPAQPSDSDADLMKTPPYPISPPYPTSPSPSPSSSPQPSNEATTLPSSQAEEEKKDGVSEEEKKLAALSEPLLSEDGETMPPPDIGGDTSAAQPLLSSTTPAADTSPDSESNESGPAPAPDAEPESIAVPAEPSPAEIALQEREAQLAKAQTELEALKAQLSGAQKAQAEREQQWQTERAEMQEQLSRMQAQVNAAEEAAAAAATSPRPASSHRRTMSSSAVIASLQAKNARLEQQMAEMKETWQAYLDLLIENQRAQEAERRMREEQADGTMSANNKRGARIVKPVRKQGFLTSVKATLFSRGNSSSGSKSNVSSPNPAASSSSRTSATSPRPAAGAASPSASSNSQTATPARTNTGADSAYTTPNNNARAHQSSHTPDVSRTATTDTTLSSSPSFSTISRDSSFSSLPPATSPTLRASFDQAIRIGFLHKKPVGFSLSIKRAWKRRLFVLRPYGLDYYDAQNLVTTFGGMTGGAQQQQSDGGSGVTSPSNGKDRSGRRGSTNFVPLGAPPPSNLLDTLRGTILLDAQTSVMAVAYPDAIYGFEITTKDKHTKLHASSEAELAAWMKDLTALISCKKAGVDPSTLVPSTPELGVHGDVRLDPAVVGNANNMLQQALASLPAQSSPIDEEELDGDLDEELGNDEDIAELHDDAATRDMQRSLFGASPTPIHDNGHTGHERQESQSESQASVSGT